jgi:hypothetical protein
MAAKKPDSVETLAFGSLRLIVGKFSTTGSIDDGDTWATGMQGTITDPSSGTYNVTDHSIVGYWGNLTTDGTQEKEGIDITESAGTLTFNVGEDNKEGIIYVLVKG